MAIIKEDMLRQSRKMKLLDQHPKFMHKKELVVLDMLVEKLQFLLGVVLHTDQKDNLLIKKENLIKVKKD